MSNPTKIFCIHCGEDCGKSPVMLNDKPFCCNGCKTVYQILNQKELGTYYKIEPMSGIKLETEERSEKYNYLDLPEIREKLLDFSDGNISKVSFFIPAIHCASCLWLLENLHSLNDGVNNSQVNFPQKRVTIRYNEEKISLRQLVELLASIHYVPDISLKDIDEKKQGSNNHRLLLKLGVAGFSFMNTMMYSFPEYLPGGELLEQEFKTLFAYLSFLLALPVVFFCASDYFLSAFKALKHKMINIDLPIAIGIITLFLQSSWDVFSGNGIGYLDSLAGLLFFLLLGKWYQSKTYQALSFERDYKSYFPVAVNLIDQKGMEKSIALANLKQGNHILIRNRELIPADSILIKGKANIDYSFVSGESIPVRRNEGDFIYAGGKQIGSSIELKVEKEVEQSYLTQLWNQDQSKHQSPSILDNLINTISKYFTIAILSIAAISGIVWSFFDYHTAIYAFTSVLIIACPCALAMSLPFTFGTSLRQFGKRNFYLKNTLVIENLYKTNTIVFDKTGTITAGNKMEVNFVGSTLDESELIAIKSVVKHSTHPLSIAIADYLEDIKLIDCENFKEIPGLGIRGEVHKSLILVGSSRFISGKELPEDSLITRVYISIDGKIKGNYTIRNHYRDGLQVLVKKLTNHYELHLLSGDNEAEKDRLQKIFGSSSNLHFNQSPEDKLLYIRNLKNQGKEVLMIGDGLNDAGALHESHAGITIADDIYQFSPACEGILGAKDFKHLYEFLRFTNKSMSILKLSFVLSFLYNIVGLTIAVQGILSPIIAAIIMPLSSISVVAFASLSINLLAKKYLPK